MTAAVDRVTELAACEAVIERNAAAFVETGNALLRIRDERLYEEAGFSGFVEYLESKPWGIGRRRAYDLIDAANVCTIVQTPNVEQARELAPLLKKATPEVARQVYAEVVQETNGKPTASIIREKVRAVIPSQRHGRKEAQPERPSQHLPDLIDPDSPRNLRTQIVKWCELGRHIESLLDNQARLEPKSQRDLTLIRSEIKAMGSLAKRLGGIS